MSLIVGDCLEVLASLPERSLDACVTDPPYGIGFMGKAWDRFYIEKRAAQRDGSGPTQSRIASGRSRSGGLGLSAAAGGSYDRTLSGNTAFQEWCRDWATEVLRVLKPGAYLLSCGGTRTFHRLGAGIEDAGFEIRDCLSWMYGQGFPKSMKVAEGIGTALKPAWEPIVMARKPLDGTTGKNHERHATGGINVDACRIDVPDGEQYEQNHSGERGHDGTRAPDHAGATSMRPGGGRPKRVSHGGGRPNGIYGDGTSGSHADGFTTLGRWPPNVCLDEEAAAMLDEQAGELSSGEPIGIKAGVQGVAFGKYAPGIPVTGYGDTGGTSRFFYVAKASRAEREEGCLSLPLRSAGEVTDREDGTAGLKSPRAGAGRTSGARNFHPTVKPIALMRWLVRLVTPPGGHVLDPFTGSGTMGIACALEDREFTGIEIDPEYARIAQARLDYWRAQPKQMVLG